MVCETLGTVVEPWELESGGDEENAGNHCDVDVLGTVVESSFNIVKPPEVRYAHPRSQFVPQRQKAGMPRACSPVVMAGGTSPMQESPASLAACSANLRHEPSRTLSAARFWITRVPHTSAYLVCALTLAICV